MNGSTSGPGMTLTPALYAEMVRTLRKTQDDMALSALGGNKHETINHGAGEYARGNVTTNGIESVFAVLKRGLHGVYHHASPKHLGRYVNEFAFRLNEGNVERHTLARLDSFIINSAGKRLTYGALVA